MEAEATERKVEELSGRIQGCARDFLRRFGGNTCHDEPPELVAAAAREEVEEIELRLGLSLGGRFGVEPEEKKEACSVIVDRHPVDVPLGERLPGGCSPHKGVLRGAQEEEGATQLEEIGGQEEEMGEQKSV